MPAIPASPIITGMEEQDVIRHMGRFPDEIVDADEVMRATVWKCSRCGKRYESAVPLAAPVPCTGCGSIFFEVA